MYYLYRMKMHLPFLFIQALFGLAIFAQTTTKGQWTATPMAGGEIIKLRWTHKAIKQNEQVSNAVILNPSASEQLVVPNKKMALNDQPFYLLTKGNGLQIIAGSLNLEVVEGFDSSHIRGIRFKMPGNAPWYGGGERATSMIRNGQRISLFNAPAYGYGEGQDQLNYSVPFIMTTGGYGLFFDNPSKGYIDFGKTKPGILEAAFVSGKLDVYIIPGKTPAEIIKKYSDLTGRQPLPPRWALGNFVSRFGYLSQQQAENVVASMKKDSFPMDAIIIDLFWFGKTIQYTLGNLDWDKDNWPEPQKMIAGFRKDNINTILITEPFIIEGTKEYKNSIPYLSTDANGKPFRLEEFYFGKGGIIDLFRKDARDWFWQFYKRQNAIGVAGWWGDLGEPENHPAEVMHNLTDLGITRKMKAYEVHNIYGHYWSQMVYENWKKDYPDKRLFFLNRAGYAGSQRFSIFPWTGDVGRSWSGFRAQIPSLQSMSMSGIPFAHSDAGGFAMTDKADKELYTRWLQFASFTPIFRPHGSALEGLTPEGTISLPSEPTFWEEKTKAIALKTIRERYRLLPYNYTLAWEQTKLGKPLLRPMMYDNAQDTNLLKANDQYMWGNALLVAPVLYPGATSRKVYLPAGTWYDYHNNFMVVENAGVWLEIPVSIETIPVFVKGGAFIPTWEKQRIQSTEEFKTESLLSISWFPGQNIDTSYVYLDDGNMPEAQANGENYGLMKWNSYKDGATVKLSCHLSGSWQPSIKSVKLQIPVNGLDEFIGGAGKRRFRVLVNGEDYFGGEIKADLGSMLSIYLNADISNEIAIQKVD